MGYPCQENLFIHDMNTYFSMLGILTYINMKGSIYRVFNNINMEFWFLASSFVGRNSVLVPYCFIWTFPKSKIAAVSHIGFGVLPKNDFFDIEMTQR